MSDIIQNMSEIIFFLLPEVLFISVTAMRAVVCAVP